MFGQCLGRSIAQIFAGVLGLRCFEQVIKSTAYPRHCGDDHDVKTNQILHPVLKTKREITKYINWQQFTKGTRGKPNEQLFPKQVVIQLPKIYKICH